MNKECAIINNKPMRVAMLGIHGKMSCMYLPEKRKGKYYFSYQNGKNCEVPVCVVDENNLWVLKGINGVRLYMDEQDIGDKAVLNREKLIGVSYNGQEYIVYTEEENENDAMFLPYVIPEHRPITIGRDNDNSIIYYNNYVSLHHAKIWKEDGRLFLRDEQSTNGIYVNGNSVQECSLVPGDTIYIMGLYMIIGPGFICINNKNKRVLIEDKAIFEADLSANIIYAEEKKMNARLFDRLPRRKYQLETHTIEVSGPPIAMNGGKTPMMLRMGTTLLSGSRALLSGNYLMAMSSMLMPMMNQGISEKEKEKYDEIRLLKYREYLQKKRMELYAERDREFNILNELYPPLNDVLKFATQTERLWEKRYIDDDFLNIRIGTGKQKLKAEVVYPKEQLELVPDMLNQEMREVVDADYDVYRAPICLSMRENYITGLVGMRAYIQQICASMIQYLCFTHSYDEVKIIILGGQQDTAYIQEEMGCFRYIPHCWGDLKDIRFIAEDKADACIIGEYLKRKLEERFNENNVSHIGKEKYHPVYVIFAFNKELLDCIEVIKDVVGAKAYPGVSIVTAYESALKESSCLISMEKTKGTMIDLQKSSDWDIEFYMERCDKNQATNSLRMLMQTKLKTDDMSFSLPKTFTFLEMFNAGRVEYLNPLTRWKNSNPTKSLATPIGIGTDGKLFYLDLHQKRQGPHGLVAGMTGSGKSEFIITYILSLAVNFSPDEVAFVLIDYKGGGLTTAFDDPKRGIHLPHVVGTITNLDGAAINRSLTSIQSELKRRQAVFNEAKSLNNEGTMDIYDYQKLYRAGKVKEPMPHLFLISDEFAELKKQQPEFMDALISTARIGRSLGVHLILATQKPTGVVNDQIWSNTRFRVCLKVQERSDSMEMLKRQEAAELKDTGRFYLQVGYNEYFALGQSAWCGADYIPQDEAIIAKDESVDFLDTTGQVVLSAKQKKNVAKSEMKQLVAIVQYLSDLAKEQKIQPRRLWTDPLPEKLEYDGAVAGIQNQSEASVAAFVGLADDPEKQRRLPFFVQLSNFRHMILCGNSGTGKSTFIRTMLYSLVQRYSPDEIWYYILDLSGGALNAFKALPHCGCYLTDDDETDFQRLIGMIKVIANERKKLFKENDVTNFEAYRQNKKLPHILLIIDGYTNITGFETGSSFNLAIHELLRDTAPLGIHFIFTINHLNELSAKGRMEVDYRVTLQAKDKYDYGEILGTRVNRLPTMMNGTGLCCMEERVLEYHVAIPDAQLGERERAAKLKERLQQIACSYSESTHARYLPSVDENLTYAELCDRFATGRIPLGISTETCADIAIPLKQLHNMGIYLGNPDAANPVLDNLLFAARKNKMRVIVLTANFNSQFVSGEQGTLKEKYADMIELLPCTAEGAKRLDDMLTEELTARNVYRDEYCRQHDIPSTDRSRILKAAGYVYQRTEPIMYLIESMADLCNCGMTTETAADLAVYFERTKGYNVYFTGLFYPGDMGSISGSNELVRALTKEQFLLAFGGRYDQCMMMQLPMEIRKQTKPLLDYSKYYMKYRDAFYRLHMPCKKNDGEEIEPDDQAII